MDSEFFQQGRLAAVEIAAPGPRPPLPRLHIPWDRQGDQVILRWPDGSPFVRFSVAGLELDKALLSRVLLEAWRRLAQGLGLDALRPYHRWLIRSSLRPKGPALDLPVFLLVEVLDFDPMLDLDLKLQIFPPGDLQA